MKLIKNIFGFLNGKKTSIGMALMLISMGIEAFFPDLLPAKQVDYIETIGLIIGGGGLLHKGAKLNTKNK